MEARKEAKLVFNAGVARKLLHVGCTIIDVKQAKDNPDKTVFVFKADDLFWSEFERINNEIAASKNEQ